MKIAIVEDELRIREGIEKMIFRISGGDCDVKCAEDGREGIVLIEAFKPDLIITDIRMPEMDGLKMLKVLRKKGELPRTIILSAYSEFEYARQALKLGVDDYILKPVSISEFSEIFKKSVHIIEAGKLREEEAQKEETPDSVLTNILRYDYCLNAAQKEELERKYGLRNESLSSLVLVYLGDQFEEKKKRVQQVLEENIRLSAETESFIWELDQERMVGILLYNYDHQNHMERWMQRQAAGGLNEVFTDSCCMGMIELEDLDHLKEAYRILDGNLKWNISLGKGVMISWPKAERIQTVPLVYPISFEQEMREYLCTMNTKKIKEAKKSFLGYFKQGICYEPQEIQKSFVKFVWSILNVIREIDAKCYETFEQQIILEKLMQARTFGELEDVLTSLTENVLIWQDKNSVDDNILIKRVKSMVHERYGQGITLNEIAATFGITPEYLGTQFHKQAGVTYSNYLKKFRMEKAKKLLLGTDLKTYEVAIQVGYTDPKYFSRVFKEVTGELPGDFRKRSKV